MLPEDMAAVEDAVLRAIQKKTSPRWAQDWHSHEGIKEAIDRVLGQFPPRPGTLTWYIDYDTGNDTTGNGGEDKPYKTIGKTLTVATAKDTLICYGDFDEGNIITTKGLRFLGLGNGLTTIQTTSPTGPTTFDFRSGADGCLVAGWLAKARAAPLNSIEINEAHNLSIMDNFFYPPVNVAIDIDENVSRCKILRNYIHGTTASAIILYSYGAGKEVKYNLIKDNIIVNSASHGIRMYDDGAGECDENSIIGNRIINSTAYGIHVVGGNSNLFEENTVLRSGTEDFYEVTGSNDWINNHFARTTTGTHTTSGGIEETVFTDTCIQPMTRDRGYLRVDTLVAGDDFTLRVKRSYDSGVTWDIIDETDLVGDQLIDRYDFDTLLEDKAEQVRVTVQRNGAIDRAFYHKRTKSED